MGDSSSWLVKLEESQKDLADKEGRKRWLNDFRS